MDRIIPKCESVPLYFKAASRLDTCAFHFTAASCKKNDVKSWLFMGIKGREWNSDYQVILGSEECLSEIGDAFQTRHFLSDTLGVS